MQAKKLKLKLTQYRQVLALSCSVCPWSQCMAVCGNLTDTPNKSHKGDQMSHLVVQTAINCTQVRNLPQSSHNSATNLICGKMHTVSHKSGLANRKRLKSISCSIVKESWDHSANTNREGFNGTVGCICNFRTWAASNSLCAPLIVTMLTEHLPWWAGASSCQWPIPGVH